VRNVLRMLFYPILSVFESGAEPYVYKKSHRTILNVIGVLFSALSLLVFWLSRGQDSGYLLPVIIFGGVGLVSLIVGFTGNDRAVAKIWGSR